MKQGNQNKWDNMRKNLSVFDKHRLKIARQTIRMNDAFINVMGGMTREEAYRTIEELTGKKIKKS